jgi:hypothetical protein
MDSTLVQVINYNIDEEEKPIKISGASDTSLFHMSLSLSVIIYVDLQINQVSL